MTPTREQASAIILLLWAIVIILTLALVRFWSGA